MRPKSRLRFLAWLCVVGVLLAAVSPWAASLPDAILASTAAILCEPSLFSLLRAASEIRPPDLLVLRGVAARAPPLA